MDMFMKIKLISLPLFIILGLSACATSDTKSTLYDDLGGKAGITRIADNFLYQISEDEVVLPQFAKTDIERFHAMIIEHFSQISGGPVEYTGDNMVEVHKKMNITPAQFNSIVEDLVVAMEDAGTPVSAQNRLLELLALLYNDIIGDDFK